jgi:hypothetical protein
LCMHRRLDTLLLLFATSLLLLRGDIRRSDNWRFFATRCRGSSKRSGTRWAHNKSWASVVQMAVIMAVRRDRPKKYSAPSSSMDPPHCPCKQTTTRGAERHPLQLYMIQGPARSLQTTVAVESGFNITPHLQDMGSHEMPSNCVLVRTMASRSCAGAIVIERMHCRKGPCCP